MSTMRWGAPPPRGGGGGGGGSYHVLGAYILKPIAWLIATVASPPTHAVFRAAAPSADYVGTLGWIPNSPRCL